MKIAHFSDLHLLALDGVPARRFLNKRLTGWINIRLKRGSIHRASYVRAVAREVARLGIDHVIVTGDLTNLALEGEFSLARDVLERDLGMDPDRVTVVPGNHDVYTRGSLSSGRYERYLAPWLESDLPELATSANGGHFPVVKLRGEVAVIGLSTAVPRPPLVAAGELGAAQLSALVRVLEHPDVARRTVIIALHHPAVQAGSRVALRMEGLRDAPDLLAAVRRLSRGMIVHGHLHRRVQRTIQTDAGQLHQVGATSASLEHDAPDRMAGFNLYEVGAAGVGRVDARVYRAETDAFRVESIPKYI